MPHWVKFFQFYDFRTWGYALQKGTVNSVNLKPSLDLFVFNLYCISIIFYICLTDVDFLKCAYIIHISLCRSKIHAICFKIKESFKFSDGFILWLPWKQKPSTILSFFYFLHASIRHWPFSHYMYHSYTFLL